MPVIAPGCQSSVRATTSTSPHCDPSRTGVRTVLPFGIIQRRRATLRRTLNDTGAVSESRAKEDVGVGEEALLERDDDELRTAETRAEERADVLRVR